MNLLLKKINFDQCTLKYLVTALLFSLLLSGCVISPRRTVGGGGATPTPTPTPSPTPTPTPAAQGLLYVANQVDDSILRFSGAATANGDLAPAATIQGNLTGLEGANYIFLDSANDRLYVANQAGGSILVFDSASTITGNAQPTRTITGITAPIDVAVDNNRDLLYVASGLDVFVFNSASTVNSNAAFSHDIKLGFQPSAIFLDSANDRLFVADLVGNAIDVFDAASTLNSSTGNLTPTRSIKGPSTKLNAPSGVTVDAVGKLIVSNANGNSITIYSDAAGGDGDLPADVEIFGASTTLDGPAQIAVNRSNTLVELFVANSNGGNVPIFSDLGAQPGNIAPSRNINGTNTKLTVGGAVTGIALDPTR